MSVFDLLGAAGAGYTQGLSTSEQFKFKNKEKEKQEKVLEQYKMKQYELALRKQQFDEEEAKGKETAGLRQLAFKSLMEGETKFATDQNWVAAMTPEARARAQGHLGQLRRLVTSSATTADDFMRVFATHPEVYGDEPRQLGSASPPQEFGQVPGQGLTTPPGYPALERGDTSPNPIARPEPPRLNRQQPNLVSQAPNIVTPQAQPPSIEGLVAQGFTPDYAAKVVADYQRSVGSQATARYNTARAAGAEAELPFKSRQAEATLADTKASTGLKGVQAGVLRGNLGLNQAKFAESTRQWGAEFAASRQDQGKKFAFEERMTKVAEGTASVLNDLRRAQIGMTGAELDALKLKTQQMAQIDPLFKLVFDNLDMVFVKNPWGGPPSVDQNALGAIAGLLEGAQSQAGQYAGGYLREYGEQLPGSAFFPRAGEGGQVIQGNPGIPGGQIDIPNALPLLPPGYGGGFSPQPGQYPNYGSMPAGAPPPNLVPTATPKQVVPKQGKAGKTEKLRAEVPAGYHRTPEARGIAQKVAKQVGVGDEFINAVLGDVENGRVGSTLQTLKDKKVKEHYLAIFNALTGTRQVKRGAR
jgi:hypothetical protein